MTWKTYKPEPGIEFTAPDEALHPSKQNRQWRMRFRPQQSVRIVAAIYLPGALLIRDWQRFIDNWKPAGDLMPMDVAG